MNSKIPMGPKKYANISKSPERKKEKKFQLQLHSKWSNYSASISLNDVARKETKFNSLPIMNEILFSMVSEEESFRPQEIV